MINKPKNKSIILIKIINKYDNNEEQGLSME